MSLKIGNTILKHGIILAPLAGVADYAFRRICRSCGAELTVSEMISAKAICYGDKKTPLLAKITEYEAPEAIQLFGSDPAFMAAAARRVAAGEFSPGLLPAAIDINCGCPVNKIVSNGEGSALMRTPELVGEIVRAVKAAADEVSDIPVTVKIRAGWDENSINAVEVARCAEEAGASLIAVHGRTRTQMYSGRADRSVIKAVKDAVKVPVIANGDIYSADDALSILSETGCDGIMVARGALGNPHIFEEITARFEDREFIPPTVPERIDTALRHLSYIIEDKGEHIGILQARKHLSWYIKGMRGSARLRDEVNRTESFDEVKALMERLLSEAEEH
ncbi:MAG: tRNA dihydrouridine synthase DusB [Clostridia bacterium]|nr:tRNA dihydrouridine synthase DusB [Clostridia bacterium]